MQEAVQTVFQVDKNAVMFSGKVNDPLTFKNGEKQRKSTCETYKEIFL